MEQEQRFPYRSPYSESIELPAGVESRLRAVRRRDIFLRILRGLLITGTALLGLALTALAIDWLLVPASPIARSILTLAVLVTSVVVFVFYFVRPLAVRRRLSKVALVVDRALPEMEERCSTVAEMAECTDPPEIRGADSLIRAVAEEAENLTVGLPLGDVIPARTTVRWLPAFAGVLAIGALLFFVTPTQMRILFQRFLSPTKAICLTQVTSLTGDKVVVKGEPLALQAKVDGRRYGKADLSIRRPKEDEELLSLDLSSDTPQTCEYTIRSVKQSFEYRFRSGDGYTPWHRISAVDRPNIAEVRFRITPPEYSKMPTDERDLIPRRCRALEGSAFLLGLLPTKPLADMKLTMGATDAVTLVPSEENWYWYRTILTTAITFSPQLTDEYGFTNPSPPSCQILVYPDRPPSVEVTFPAPEIVVLPDDKIPIEFQAVDDFGISFAELLVTTESPEGEIAGATIAIPFDANEPAKLVRKSVELDLEPYNLKNGSQVRYAVRVTDTRLAQAMSTGPTDNQRPGDSGQNAEEGSLEETPSQPTTSQQDQTGERISQEERPESQVAYVQSQENKVNQSSSSTSRSSSARIGESTPSEEKQTAQKSNPPPPNNMSMRELNVGQSSTSKQQNILVDEWAGSFEGQAREKLQIAIDEYLKRLKESWTAALELTTRLHAHVDQNQPWKEPEDKDLGKARDRLTESESAISELISKSKDTPYAFIGMQIQDIGLSHVAPARKSLVNVSSLTAKPEEMKNELATAMYHISTALALLGKWTEQYETVKQEEKLAEAMERVKKMHQIFIEDMQAFLRSAKEALNPRSPKYTEVSEEYAKLLKEQYEKLKELYAELAKILSENPELMRRFAALQRLQGTTIRDQLTVLARRQKALYEQIDEWIKAGEEGRAALQAKHADLHKAELLEIWESTTNLGDTITTWIPRDVDKSKSPWSDFQRLSAETILLQQDVARLFSLGEVEKSLELAEKTTERLTELHDRLAAAAVEEASSESHTIFLVRRIFDAEKLGMRQSGWITKVRSVREGGYAAAGDVDQSVLMMDTVDFGGKLSLLLPWFQRLSEEIGTKGKYLKESIEETIVGHQTDAVYELWKEDLPPAREAEGKAVVAFATAENMFDELLTLVEQAIAALPPPERPPGGTPSLEALLALLENEQEAAELLGNANALNIAANFDWLLPQSGVGGASGMGAMGASGGRIRRAMQEMERVRQEAAQRARQIRQEAEPKPAEPKTGPEEGPSRIRERDWLQFASRLKDELRQGRDTIPPAKYRQAIEDYFTTIAGTPAE